jgi:uncharacterized protein (TIGR03792 family)
VIVEELVFRMHPDDVAGYLAADARHWTAFLSRQPGFVRKEVWCDIDDPGVVRAVIWWATELQWKAITPDQVAEIDARMGRHFHEPVMRRHAVVAGPVTAVAAR